MADDKLGKQTDKQPGAGSLADNTARRIGSFKAWADAELEAEAVARIIDRFLSGYYQVEVSKYTSRLGSWEWELKMAVGVFLADADYAVGKIWVREQIGKDPSDGTRAAGIEYGYGIPAEIVSGWDRELLADIYVQGKKRVDEHFGFGGTVSSEAPWDAEPDEDKRRILRIWHPLGQNMKSGEIADRLWGDEDGYGTYRVTPHEKRKLASQKVTQIIYELRQKHGTDIVPYKRKKNE